jgi:hypothetical protein
MIVDKNYSVLYQYENTFGVACSERRQFDTEEEADKFIQDLLNDGNKCVWKIVKNVWTNYYSGAEKK